MSYDNDQLEATVNSSATFTKPDGGIGVRIRTRKLHTVINDFKRQIGKGLESRLKHVFNKPNLMVATLLDPRFKGLCFDDDQLKLACEYVKTEVLLELNNQKADDSLETEPIQEEKRQKTDLVGFTFSEIIIQKLIIIIIICCRIMTILFGDLFNVKKPKSRQKFEDYLRRMKFKKS